MGVGGPGLLAALLVLGCASTPVLRDVPGLGGIEGALRVVHAGPEAQRPQAVVYLTREDGRVPAWPRRTLTVERSGEGFEPAFGAVARGRSLRLVNRGGLHHRLFALTPDGRLDVSLPPHARVAAPTSGSGMLRFYCSLHPEESFSVFVAPYPWFAVVDARGRYEIRGVPPGTWRLYVWTDAVEGPVRRVRVDFWTLADEDVLLDARLMTRR